ncbi:putative ribonuclease H-like domain-containing protein [Tanacetum coccineum]
MNLNYTMSLKRFKMLPGENINEYYVRFHKLVNDMRNIRMIMHNIQLNSKFVNNMSPEWDRMLKGKQNQNQRIFCLGITGSAGNGGAQNRAGNATAGQGNQSRVINCNRPENGAVLDEDETYSLWCEQGTPLMHCMEHEIHNKVQPSNVIDSTSVHMGNSNVIPYEQYVSVNDISVVPSCASSALSSVCVSPVNDAIVPHDPIAIELKIYKEQVAIYEQRAKFELTEREQRMDDQMRMLIQNRNKTEENLKKELHSFKLQLKSTMENNKIIEETVTTLKQEFKQKESKFLTDFSNLKHLNDKLENKLHSQDQSIQTVHMMLNPTQNKDLTAKLNALHDLNECFRAKNAKVKQHYKELYDSIKITRAKTTDQNNSLLSEIEHLKDQLKENSKCVTIPDCKPKVLAPGRYPIDVEPIPPRLKKNREVHLHYIERLKENVETLREIVEDAKVERPLDTSLASACHYTKHSQELLEYQSSATKVWRVKQVKQVWKATGKLFTTIGHQWRPTGRLLPLGDQWPLTRNTPPKVLPTKQWKPTADPQETIAPVVQIVLWYLDSGCSKHMTGDRSRLRNFVKKFIGTVRFGNDHFGAIMGYGDYVIGDSVISRVYYVEGLGHNLFSVGQFCDSDLEVAFRKHTCFVRDLDGVDLIKGSHARKDLVRGLPQLKFEKDHLCSACQLGKSRKATHKPKMINTITEVLYTLHIDLCGLLRVQSINGKKYILVIVDDYSRFTWVKFLRSKDETPVFVINLLKQLQVGLNKTVRFVRTNNGTEFVNKNLTDFYESVGITHEKTVPRTPQQNGVVERRNRTLVEAARTMLIFSKAPLFLWAEAVATACYTQNRSLIHTLHNKTPYELVHDKKLDLSFLRIFGALCYPTNNSKDLGKLKAKADIGFFVGYAPNRKGYRIYNKRIRQIMETIHVTFDELTEQTARVHSSSGPNYNLLTLGPISSGLVPNSAPAISYVPPTNKDLELLFQPMFDEYFETPTGDHQMPHVPVVPPSVILTGPSVSISFDHDAPSGSHSPSSSAHQSSSVHHGVATEHSFEVNLFAATEHEPFVNVFAPDPNSEASSSGTLTIPTPNQSTQPHEHPRKWTDSHPLDNIIGNPSRPISTRKQLATDALWCFYNSVLSKVEPKNFQSAVSEDCWFQAMQDEIHKFDRLDVWELVPPLDCAMIIALKWIYKVKLDEYGDVLKNKARLVAKGYR